MLSLIMFQFHTGSIKSAQLSKYVPEPFRRFNSILVRLKEVGGPMCSSDWDTFQFHTGSIKSSRLADLEQMMHSFNSILVRLKGRIRMERCMGNTCFNSILVRLKGVAGVIISMLTQVSIPYWFD